MPAALAVTLTVVGPSESRAQTAAQLADPVAMRALEAADTMPATDFFDVKLTPGRAGSLLRARQTAGFHLPTGAVATRILYRSRATKGGVVASLGDRRDTAGPRTRRGLADACLGTRHDRGRAAVWAVSD